MILTTLIGGTLLTSSIVGMTSQLVQRPRVKINGKPFDFDSAEIYAGERVKSERLFNKNAIAIIIVIAGVLLCLWWFNGGYHHISDSYKGWWNF